MPSAVSFLPNGETRVGTAAKRRRTVDPKNSLYSSKRVIGRRWGDPETEEFFSGVDVPSGGGTIRHMYFYKPKREIWFGTDANTVGRARLK